MEKDLDRLKAEMEEERLFQYLKRFGTLPDKKEEERSLKEFN